jgi:hypothetical protein
MGCSSFDATNARFSRAVRARRAERLDECPDELAPTWLGRVFFAAALGFVAADVVPPGAAPAEVVGLAAGSVPAVAGTCAVRAGTGGFAVEGELAAGAGVAVDCAGADIASARQHSRATEAASNRRKKGGAVGCGKGKLAIVTLYAELDARERCGESLA